MVMLAEKARLSQSLGIAIVSRNQELLKTFIEELGYKNKTEIQSIWKEIESDLQLDDVTWFREKLCEIFPGEVQAEPLTDDEKNCKQQIEFRLHEFLSSFVARGKDLHTLRTQRLYREEFPNWETYCRFGLGIHVTNADRLIKSVEIVESLQPIGSILPRNEFVARELGKVKDTSTRQLVWQRAVESGNPTADVVKQIRLELSQSEQPPTTTTFEPQDLVIINSPASIYNGYWGRIFSVTNNNRYKVQVGNELVTLKANEISCAEIDKSLCERVEFLDGSPHNHIAKIASTFHAYMELDEQQIKLLTFLEGLCH